MMRVTMLQPAADGAGRTWRPGRTYPVPDDEGRRLIDAGAARAARTEVPVEIETPGGVLQATLLAEDDVAPLVPRRLLALDAGPRPEPEPEPRPEPRARAGRRR